MSKTKSRLADLVGEFLDSAPSRMDRMFRAYALKSALEADPSGDEMKKLMNRAVEVNAEEMGVSEKRYAGVPMPCPFCGEPPKWIEMEGWPGLGVYECANPKCYMVARNVGRQTSLEQWNKRADARCPTCRGRNSRAGERTLDDGSVIVWHCNVPGCANYCD